MKGKKYVIEPNTDEETNKRLRVHHSDVNEADRLYKLWLRKIRRLNNWRPVKKVQKTDIFGGVPGIALVDSDKKVERYGLQWVHDDAKASSDEES